VQQGKTAIDVASRGVSDGERWGLAGQENRRLVLLSCVRGRRRRKWWWYPGTGGEYRRVDCDSESGRVMMVKLVKLLKLIKLVKLLKLVKLEVKVKGIVRVSSIEYRACFV
jgi:hypothetical protein